VDVKDIKSPDFLKDLSIAECEALSADIRNFLVENLSQTGGHFSSNMGVVELTVALHKVFDSPKDKIIFDVGHQGYVHKILTGRANEFATLRQTDGLSGFLKREESPHDVYEAGHSSTSIAAAAGMLFARPFQPSIGHVVALIGDGALASGMALEALNFIGHYPEKNPIIVLNDNEMSISENVGHLARMMTNLRMRRSYRSLRRKTSRLVPKRFRGFTSKIEKRIKGFLTGHTYFESLGYQYYGLLDGHDFKQLLKAFEVAKKSNQPTVIHVRTVKGKGYEPSEQDKLGKWHGAPPFHVENGEFFKGRSKDTLPYCSVVARMLEHKAEKDKEFYVVTPAMIGGSDLHSFQERFPKQLIDTGIAEATAMTLSCSLALSNTRVFLTMYSTFLQRAYDQVLHDVARQKADLVVGVDRSGLVGADGDTHQGLYDIPMLSHIPGVTIAQPKDAEELLSLFAYAFEKHKGPIFIRYPKENTRFDPSMLENVVPAEKSWTKLTGGSQGTIIAFGQIVETLRARIADENLDVTLINARFIKPLDEKLLDIVNPKKPLIVYEESTLQGGLGSAICHYFARQGRPLEKVRTLGFEEAFVEHGDRNILLKRYGLSADDVLEKMKALIDEA